MTIKTTFAIWLALCVSAFSRAEKPPGSARVQAPASVSPGEVFDVTWDGPGEKSDTIRIGTKHGGALPKASWTFAVKNEGNIVKLKAPTEPGDYTVVYFMKKVRLADTPITVRAPGAWVLADQVMQENSQVALQFGGVKLKDGDVVGIVAAGSTKPPAGKASKLASKATAGGVIVLVPKGPGKYEVVYSSGEKILAQQPVKVVKQSVVFVAPDEVVATLGFEIKWNGRGNVGDRIMLYSGPEKKELNVLRHMAHMDTADRVAWINAPETPGDYELRYKSPSGRRLGKKAFKIVAPDKAMGRFRVNGAMSKEFLRETMFEIVIDASGEMLKEEGNKTRMEGVKAGVIKYLKDSMKEGSHVAIRTVTDKGTSLEYPLQVIDHGSVTSSVSKIKSPESSKRAIADALVAVADDLKGTTGDSIVVLITSGDETAGGDPALAIRHLRKVGSGARVSVIGYGIKPNAHAIKNKFLSWAELGRGRYHTAKGERDLPMCISHAMSVPYELYQGDKKIAAGNSATGPYPLPVGKYQVRYQVGDTKVTKDVVVSKGELTDISIP